MTMPMTMRVAGVTVAMIVSGVAVILMRVRSHDALSLIRRFEASTIDF